MTDPSFHVHYDELDEFEFACTMGHHEDVEVIRALVNWCLDEDGFEASHRNWIVRRQWGRWSVGRDNSGPCSIFMLHWISGTGRFPVTVIQTKHRWTRILPAALLEFAREL